MSDKSGGRLDTSLIRELAAILREADLGEIEVEFGDLHVRVARQETNAPVYAPAPVQHVAAAQHAPAANAAQPAAASPASGASAPKSSADHPGVVKSPMVGTVYLAPETGAAPFVKPGDTVREGQTLLLVEAMKTFNPVTAPRAGKVAEIIVSNEQPVEYGEPLVVIE